MLSTKYNRNYALIQHSNFSENRKLSFVFQNGKNGGSSLLNRPTRISTNPCLGLQRTDPCLLYRGISFQNIVLMIIKLYTLVLSDPHPHCRMSPHTVFLFCNISHFSSFHSLSNNSYFLFHVKIFSKYTTYFFCQRDTETKQT